MRPCLDETVNNERFGVCIRKTNYRKQQEDRVSIIYNISMENTSKMAVFIIQSSSNDEGSDILTLGVEALEDN